MAKTSTKAKAVKAKQVVSKPPASIDQRPDDVAAARLLRAVQGMSGGDVNWFAQEIESRLKKIRAEEAKHDIAISEHIPADDAPDRIVFDWLCRLNLKSKIALVIVSHYLARGHGADWVGDVLTYFEAEIAKAVAEPGGMTGLDRSLLGVAAECHIADDCHH
jgi:hypothetical protein